VGLHPDIRCLSEPFALHNYQGRYHRSTRDPVSLDAVLDLIWDRWNSIKHVWDFREYPFFDRGALNDRLAAAPGVRILLLRRRNLLRRWVSNYISLQTNHWAGPRTEFLEKVGAAGLRPLDVEAVRRQIESDRDTATRRARSLAERNAEVLPIFYEDLYRDDAGEDERRAAVNSILEFLDFAPLDTERFHKQWSRLLEPHNRWASEEVYRLIPGIEEVEAECGSDETGWLFR
jgi:hypothetical protein